MDGIGRKRLPHDPPLGIGTGGALFFVTICAVRRSENPLIQPGIPEMLIEAARHRSETGVWYARLFLVMPDHIHALIRVPTDGSLRRPIFDWKRWTATKGVFEWQEISSTTDCARRNPNAKRQTTFRKIRSGRDSSCEWKTGPGYGCLIEVGGFIEPALPPTLAGRFR